MKGDCLSQNIGIEARILAKVFGKGGSLKTLTLFTYVKFVFSGAVLAPIFLTIKGNILYRKIYYFLPKSSK